MLRKIIAYQDYKKIDNTNFHDDVNDFAFDQFDVTSRKQYLMYLMNELQSNKNIFEQITFYDKGIA